jgi:hypothetical protein
MKKLFFILLSLTFLAFVALGFDLSENIRLTQWINQGYTDGMWCFEALVRLKFLFAFLGIGTGISAHIFMASIPTPTPCGRDITNPKERE